MQKNKKEVGTSLQICFVCLFNGRAANHHMIELEQKLEIADEDAK